MFVMTLMSQTKLRDILFAFFVTTEAERAQPTKSKAGWNLICVTQKEVKAKRRFSERNKPLVSVWRGGKRWAAMFGSTFVLVFFCVTCSQCFREREKHSFVTCLDATKEPHSRLHMFDLINITEHICAPWSNEFPPACLTPSRGTVSCPPSLSTCLRDLD